MRNGLRGEEGSNGNIHGSQTDKRSNYSHDVMYRSNHEVKPNSHIISPQPFHYQERSTLVEQPSRSVLELPAREPYLHPHPLPHLPPRPHNNTQFIQKESFRGTPNIRPNLNSERSFQRILPPRPSTEKRVQQPFVKFNYANQTGTGGSSVSFGQP